MRITVEVHPVIIAAVDNPPKAFVFERVDFDSVPREEREGRFEADAKNIVAFIQGCLPYPTADRILSLLAEANPDKFRRT
ncbi:MAG: hypothetical protein A3B24_01860 [Candidatus Wildermuthbacteria bacterium RIFCSPLOWO2_01_FULL_48_16]|uniref:Uncharacterized protein n=1 Tax=Candidatus Wildermuthbacteria bacterium RIFCSPLOWO2_01_FULL_48_16 TaxID=1802461 RepID=A0A1G2RMF8_9BACT|nr:MAG: hypothetical protein A3B24_01860 [Candidatus Wildermuthbacteria bacterium RIFCSPLOWO2_01_FULL_48_16]